MTASSRERVFRVFHTSSFIMFNRRVLLAVCVLFCVGVFTRGVVVYIEKFEEHLGGEISLRLEETALYTTERIGSVLSETKGRLHDMAVAVAEGAAGFRVPELYEP